MPIKRTLEERLNRYKSFSDVAFTCQSIKQAIRTFPVDAVNEGRISPRAPLSDAHKEALDMIAHKIARIVNGDPNYKDNWHDIAGYATLAEEACVGEDSEEN